MALHLYDLLVSYYHITFKQFQILLKQRNDLIELNDISGRTAFTPDNTYGYMTYNELTALYEKVIKSLSRLIKHMMTCFAESKKQTLQISREAPDGDGDLGEYIKRVEAMKLMKLRLKPKKLRRA